MRKVSIPVAVLIFFMAAGPVFGRPTDIPRPTREIPAINTIHPTNTAPNLNTNRATKLREVISRMLDNYQRRLLNYNDFLTKVKSRRDKLAASGKDVSKLDAFIATATDNWNAAQTVFTDVKTALGALDYTGDMGPLRKSIHDELTKLRQAFTNLHKSMRDTVSEIRGLSAGVTVTPQATGSGNGNQNGHGNPFGGPPGKNK